MNQAPIRLGPLSLLLAVITICLTTLAILTFTTARADARLAEKYAETVRTRYTLETMGQTYLAALNAGESVTPAPEAGEDGTLHCTLETQDGARLRMEFAPDGQGGYVIVGWRQDREWIEEEGIGKLWQGN